MIDGTNGAAAPSEEQYELLYQCIVSGQVSERQHRLLLEDTGFSQYFAKRRLARGACASGVPRTH